MCIHSIWFKDFFFFSFKMMCFHCCHGSLMIRHIVTLWHHHKDFSPTSDKHVEKKTEMHGDISTWGRWKRGLGQSWAGVVKPPDDMIDSVWRGCGQNKAGGLSSAGSAGLRLLSLVFSRWSALHAWPLPAGCHTDKTPSSWFWKWIRYILGQRRSISSLLNELN